MNNRPCGGFCPDYGSRRGTHHAQCNCPSCTVTRAGMVIRKRFLLAMGRNAGKPANPEGPRKYLVDSRARGFGPGRYRTGEHRTGDVDG